MSVTACSVAADYVERNAEALVASWIDWLKERVQTRVVTALPERALRNHVPPVLLSLSRYLRDPVELARQELLGHLRLHGQIRRDQGYSLQEVLAEFEGLADLVTRGVNRVLEERVPDATPQDMLAVATRLARGLRSVSFIAVGTYSESDEERAHAISTSLEEFARTITHELRNPLNTLALTIEVLRRERPEVDAHLGVMDAAVQRASSLVGTIHTLTMAEGARAGARLVRIERAVQRVIDDFAEEARQADVRVRLETSLPEVSAEAMILYVVLANVIGNALKYSDAAKRERWVKITMKVIDEKSDSGFCEIRVQDNGVGIPAELLPRVTQKGFRAHPDLAPGTGLGLHIVQQALSSRGGTLEIVSKEGKGSEFTVRIRCLRSDADVLTAGEFSVQSLMGEMTQPPDGKGAAQLPDDQG